jgi:hypothetical protein
MITARFSKETHFYGSYKRNNKAKSKKNLRCFPDCRPNGHQKNGYCGRPVIVEVVYDTASTKDLDFMAFCELRCVDDISSNVHTVSLGKNFAYEDILSQSRGTGSRPGVKALHPWFPGFIIASNPIPNTTKVHTTFSFNYKNQGWLYPWKAQSRPNTKHELHIFILAGSKQLPLCTCICSLSSPAFHIHCRQKSQAEAPSPAAHTQCSVYDPLRNKRSAAEMNAFMGATFGGERTVSPPTKQKRLLGLSAQHDILKEIMPSNAAAISPDSLKRTVAAIPSGQGKLRLIQPFACESMPQLQQPVYAAPATFASQDAVKQILPPLSHLIRGLPFGLVAKGKVPTSTLPTSSFLTSAPILPIPQLEAMKGQFHTQIKDMLPEYTYTAPHTEVLHSSIQIASIPPPPPTPAIVPSPGHSPKHEFVSQGVCTLPVASAVLHTYPGPTERKPTATDPLSVLALCAAHD